MFELCLARLCMCLSLHAVQGRIQTSVLGGSCLQSCESCPVEVTTIGMATSG